jgi:hypothetical protein
MNLWSRKPKEELIRLRRSYEGSFREGEELRLIDPAHMTFLYSMGDKECHLKATGTCSLEGKRPSQGKDGEEEAAYHVCRDLLRSLRKNGQYERCVIDIAERACGHYEFNDGQHRTCVTQRLGIKIEALVNPTDELCDICKGRASKDDELR